MVGRVGGVGRHGDRAGRHHGEIGDEPLGAVFRDQQDTVAGARRAPAAARERQVAYSAGDGGERPQVPSRLQRRASRPAGSAWSKNMVTRLRPGRAPAVVNGGTHGFPVQTAARPRTTCSDRSGGAMLPCSEKRGEIARARSRERRQQERLGQGASPRPARPPEWDLGDLYGGPEAPALERDLRRPRRADAFHARCGRPPALVAARSSARGRRLRGDRREPLEADELRPAALCGGHDRSQGALPPDHEERSTRSPPS